MLSDTPICYPIQTAEYGVGRGEEVSVTCQVEANPPNVAFTWKFNNTSSSAKLSSEQISTDGTRSTAVFTPVTEFDYGILYCWAENSLGFQKNPCIYKIIPAGLYLRIEYFKREKKTARIGRWRLTFVDV